MPVLLAAECRAGGRRVGIVLRGDNEGRSRGNLAMTKRWDSDASEETEDPRVDAFLEEIAAVCKKHGLSIAHEDSHGGFLIQQYAEHNIEWLNDASRNLGR